MALLPLPASMSAPKPVMPKPVMPKPGKPFYSFPNSKFHIRLKSSRYTMGKPGCRVSCGVIPINMALITTEDGVARRIGNHHPNLWGDAFIQSLPANYDAPCYVARADKLKGEIKHIFNAMDNTLTTSPANDLWERLSLVDTVQRLGIERHFRIEIKQALHYVYSYWKDNGIGCGRGRSFPDLNTTALGLRILRLHRYDVSSDVLEQFKGENAEFLSSALVKSEEEINGILNLYRASFIAFPGEKIMDEAKAYSATYLKHALPDISNPTLSREIEYNLDYGWYSNTPRMEARNYIDIYGEDSSWAHTPIKRMAVAKLLELARLDFNMIQSVQQRELQILSRWWIESGLPQLDFPRHRHVEYYFWGAVICIEPQYSAFRIGFAKLSSLITYLDDIYDTYGTLDELKTFTKAIKRWDPSAAEGLPEFMQVVYKTFHEAVNEMAQEAEKTQGRNTLQSARKAWEDHIDGHFKEAEWLAGGYMPTFNEYLHNGKVSGGMRQVKLQTLLSLDALLPEDILLQIDYPSRFDELTCLALRLWCDTRTFKAEAERGEEVSSITCYMKDHPGSTERDALRYLEGLVEKVLKELNWEYLKADDGVPFVSKHYAYEIVRGLLLVYKEGDGLSEAAEETKDRIIHTIIKPVPL